MVNVGGGRLRWSSLRPMLWPKTQAKISQRQAIRDVSMTTRLRMAKRRAERELCFDTAHTPCDELNTADWHRQRTARGVTSSAGWHGWHGWHAQSMDVMGVGD